MYGLLKPRHSSTAQKQNHRLHYCGTCKTLGSEFGQTARMLLNHDAVFLGELLSALRNENMQLWDAAYHSWSCVTLPEKNAFPLPLNFAATSNILLTAFKINDQVIDAGKLKWRMANRFFASPFRQAEEKLRGWKFPLEELWSLQHLQDQREGKIIAAENCSKKVEALEYLSHATAQATALFFRHGATLLQLENLQPTLFQLGYDFGRLIYLLDAYEDYEKDFRANEFNAFRALYHWSEIKFTSAQRRQVTEILQNIEAEILNGIDQLPLPETTRKYFRERVTGNLARKLSLSLPVIKCTPRRYSMRERWSNAHAIGKNLTAQELMNCGTFSQWKIPFIFALVTATIFFFPQQQLNSWRDCLGLSVNLMFLGAIPTAVISTLTSFSNSAYERNKKSSPIADFCGNLCDCCGCDICCDCSCCNNSKRNIYPYRKEDRIKDNNDKDDRKDKPSSCDCDPCQGCDSCCSELCCKDCNCCDGCCDGCGCDCSH